MGEAEMFNGDIANDGVRAIIRRRLLTADISIVERKKKHLTVIMGIPEIFDLKKILRHFKRVEDLVTLGVQL